MYRQQSVQPILLACHSCRSRHCFLMAQHNGFDPADSTAPSPSSSQQTLLSNPASYAHTTSHGLPQHSWLDENSNDNTTGTAFQRIHQRLPQNYPGFTQRMFPISILSQLLAIEASLDDMVFRSSILGGHTVSVQQSLELASLHVLPEVLRGDPQAVGTLRSCRLLR